MFNTWLTIANWNVMRAVPNQSRFLSIEKDFEANHADIWFLTETHEELAPDKGYSSHFSGDPDRESKVGERWSAVWSNWPLQELKGYACDSTRSVIGRIAESEFGEIILYGNVLPWNNDYRAKSSSSYQIYADALEVQKSDWKKIQHDFPNTILIVAGDFNQGLVDFHYYGSAKKHRLLESTLKECNLVVLTAGENDPIARDSCPARTSITSALLHRGIGGSKKQLVGQTSLYPTKHFRITLE